MVRRSRVMGLLRNGVIGLVVAGATVGAVAEVSATQVYGGSYESERYGFSFEWDEGLWSASEVETPNAEGLDTESVASWGTIYAAPAEADATNCYDEIVGSMSNGEGLDAAPARYDRPEPGGGVQGELVVFTLGQGSDAQDLFFYVGCRPLDGGNAVLNVIFSTLADSYTLERDNWQELMGSIAVSDSDSRTKNQPEIGIGRARDDERSMPETGIAGDTYTHVGYGYEIGWDATDWTARELEESENVGEGIYLEGERSYALISSYFYRGAEADDCLEEWSSSFKKGSDKLENVRPAPSRYVRPEVNDNAAGELYLMNAKNKSGDLALYLECRVIPETNAIIVFHFFTGAANYAKELSSWQQVLDSVETLPLPEASGAIGAVAEVSARYLM
ncbi:MAG: hypothetical protein IT336_04360 [Thermomicrobiales bacterium]|nr:hypothetical protein [Thermomicrobiales bacterium]